MKSQTIQEFKKDSGYTVKDIARACTCNIKIIRNLLKQDDVTVMYDSRVGTLAIYVKGLLERTGSFNNDHRY